MALPNTAPGYIRCTVYGEKGYGVVDYTQRTAWTFTIRNRLPATW